MHRAQLHETIAGLKARLEGQAKLDDDSLWQTMPDSVMGAVVGETAKVTEEADLAPHTWVNTTEVELQSVTMDVAELLEEVSSTPAKALVDAENLQASARSIPTSKT